jgi:branched-subunit amino acid transport protein
VLTSLLPLSDDPYRTAESIGLPRRCGAYAGLNWYLPPIGENPANHPCREVAQTSYMRLLGLAVVEPRVFARFVGGSLDYVRPWIPSRYRGKPHLGVVEGQMQASLPEGWFSWSPVLDRLPQWLINVLVLSPPALVAALLVSRRLRRPPLASVLAALALLPLAVTVAVTFGNGYEDSAKQMHLVFTMALSFWLVLALAGLDRATGWGERAGASGRG